MRVLGIGAHPDDLEILCGGTLARYAAEGHHVAMCHVATGDKGTLDVSRSDFAVVRLAEAQAAARVIGADHFSLGIPDTEISACDRAQLVLVANLVREVRPDVIITHFPNDYYDHNEMAKLVMDGSIMALHPQIRTDHPPVARTAPVYLMEPIKGFGFSPTEYVDITAHMDTKLEMWDMHESQHQHLVDIGLEDMRDQIITTAKFRGYQAGVRYAEGFVQCQVALLAPTRRLLP